MAKNKQNKAPETLLANVVVMPVKRNASDIDTWRKALKSADGGKRGALYDLYEDLLIDGVLSDAVDNKRVGAILNAELAFQTDGKEVPEITALIDTPEFEDFLREIMLAKFWGKSVLECDFTEGFTFTSLPRRHLRPKYKELALKESDERGVSYADNDFILDIGKDTDLGLFLKTAPYVIYKRGGFGDYAQWLELFGMPHRIGKYNAYDTKSRELLLQAFSEAGSNPDLVVPKETDVTIDNSGAGGNGTSFNQFRQACNEELLVTVLGNTMTTLQGSSRAQGEVHLETQQGIAKSDRRFVQRVLNHLFLPMLEKRGYPVGKGTFYFPEAGETLTTLQRLEKDMTALGAVPISRKYFYETYDIPTPESGEELAGEWGKKVEATEPPKQPDSKLSDTPTPGGREEQNLFKQLLSFFGKAPQDGAAGTALTLSDSPEANELLKRVASGKSTHFDTPLFLHESAKLVEAFRKGWDGTQRKLADIGLDYGYVTDAYKTAMELNLFHFSAAKNIAEIQQLNQLFRASTGFDDFAKKAEALVGKFNKTWAETEYNTAYHVAESASLYQRLFAQRDIFTHWQYMTVDDGHVREEHYKLHGLILPAGDRRWDIIFPPNGWNCRCYVIPLTKVQAQALGYSIATTNSVLKEYMESEAYKKQTAQRWNTNRAKLDCVFTENQLYLRKFPKQAAKLLKDVNYHSYKLGSMQDNRKKVADNAPAYEGKAADYFAALPKAESNVKMALLTDYNGRRIGLEQKNFGVHTTGSHASRVALIRAMEETLRAPDEVWVNEYMGKRYDNFVMVKYYKDLTMCVIGTVRNGRVYTVDTWFGVAEDKVDKYRYRHGLLVHVKQ